MLTSIDLTCELELVKLVRMREKIFFLTNIKKDYSVKSSSDIFQLSSRNQEQIMSLYSNIRTFLTRSIVLNRIKPLKFEDLTKIKLREPVVPRVANFEVSPDHPLWQFFPQGNKTKVAIRESEELDLDSENGLLLNCVRNH